MDAVTRLRRYLDGDPVSIMSIDHVMSIIEEIERKDAELAAERKRLEDAQSMLGLAALKISDMREALVKARKTAFSITCNRCGWNNSFRLNDFDAVLKETGDTK